jgi:hypothetical protein
MHAERIDGRTRHLVESEKPRRALLTGLSASALAAAAGLTAAQTEAKKRKKRKKKEKPVCTRCPKICEGPDIVLCRPSPDIEVELCVCAWTTTGNVACIDFRQVTCTAADECQFDGDCGPNHACILVDEVHCCTPGNTGNLCAPLCLT